jgi:hypothetical protein
MAWTDITNAFIAVGKAVRARDIRALRDNIAALAAGEAGAPRIQRAAIAPGVVGPLYAEVFNGAGELALLIRTGGGSKVARGAVISAPSGPDGVVPSGGWRFAEYRQGEITTDWFSGSQLPSGSKWMALSEAAATETQRQVVLAVRVE